MPEPVEVQVKEAPEKEDLSEVTVHLDEKNQPVKPAETPKDEPRYVTPEQLAQSLEQAIKKATAPLYYEMRKAREPHQLYKPEPKPEPTEWEAKLQKDWKGTVEELAEAKFQALMKKQNEEAQAQAEKARTFQLLEQNKLNVLKRHPELNDEASHKSEIYRGVLQDHPEYLSNSFGPVLAMRDMEDKLKEMGVLDNSTRQVVEKEVVRQVRTNGSAIPKGTSTGAVKSITLTKEQKEFCDANGIKYESYIKYSKNPTNQGVEA